jgi:predicted dehydrogenase
MKKIRVGFVGAGGAAYFHLLCLRRVYGVEVELAGVTALPKDAERFGQEYGIPVFAGIDEMLPQVDLLDICSPPYVHEEAILKTVAAGKHIICEKPLTGYFGPGGADANYAGNRDAKKQMLQETVARLKNLASALNAHQGMFAYAENFVYSPSVQKEREIVEKTGAQLLRMMGEESHNGSWSPVYGIWRYSGGGSLIGKGCHPLSAMLYLKRVEGLTGRGSPIRPVRVSARTHELTRLPNYENKGFLRTDYHDVEDYGFMHVTFEDGTVADVITSEVVLGGIYDYVEVFANNHRTRCKLNPTGLLDTFNPKADQYADIYTIEKISTKEGWSQAAPDEYFTMGYQGEFQDFVTCAANGQAPQSGLQLALDTTATIYAAYVSDECRGQEVEIPLL